LGSEKRRRKKKTSESAKIREGILSAASSEKQAGDAAAPAVHFE
jgi:hypothetical protein